MLKQLLPYFLLVLTLTSGYTQTKIDSLKSALENTNDKASRLSTLDAITKALNRSNTQEKERYLSQYLKLAGSLDEYDLMASKSRFLIQYYIYNGKLKKAKTLCDSLLGYTSKFNKLDTEAHLLLKRGAIFFAEEKFKKANEDYTKSHDLFMKSGDSIYAADALFFSAQVSTDLNEFVDAVNRYKAASDLYEKLGDNQYALMAGAELISLYNVNGFLEKSIEENERLIKKAIANKDFNSQALLLGQRISAYSKQKKFDKVREAIDQLIKITNKDLEESWQGYYSVFILVNELQYAINTNNLEKAKIFILQLNEFVNSKKIPSYIETDVLHVKANYYDAIGDTKKVLPILEKLLFNNGAKSHTDVELKSRQKLADIYHQKGRFKDALELYKVNTLIKDSIYTSQKNNAFLYYQTEYETERRLRELTEQDAEIEKLEADKVLVVTKRNYQLAGIIIIFLIAISFFYYRYKQNIKEQAYQNLLLNNKIATKTEEINGLLSETIQHIKSKERIAENLKKLSNETEGITLSSIIADLKADKLEDSKILVLKKNIEILNYDFVKSLKSLHPNLTKTDIEVCSFIKIGLSRKEISSLRKTSIDAIKSTRFRLKKKLNLTSKDSLDEYIRSL
ncbi:conserved hypothetical protein [Tenacibaculum sp. 190524A02b]|uniref:HTH luxR-type domain-containing protein n=1 Tax=Tenacibaculum vairaonense TaxID=3137860 RepID=A0ABM9PID3_9FLAO